MFQHAQQTQKSVPRPSCLSSVSFTSNRPQVPPRVVDFEDRLKCIITSALNNDSKDRDQVGTKEKEKLRFTHFNSMPQPDYTQVIIINLYNKIKLLPVSAND